MPINFNDGKLSDGQKIFGRTDGTFSHGRKISDEQISDGNFFGRKQIGRKKFGRTIFWTNKIWKMIPARPQPVVLKNLFDPTETSSRHPKFKDSKS